MLRVVGVGCRGVSAADRDGVVWIGVHPNTSDIRAPHWDWDGSDVVSSACSPNDLLAHLDAGRGRSVDGRLVVVVALGGRQKRRGPLDRQILSNCIEQRYKE